MFNENHYRDTGDLEQTRNLGSISCDLDLESAWLINGFCIMSHLGEHLTKV